jgi:hypothetical protein
MIRPYLNKPSLVILLTILSFNLKAQSYISDGVYIGGGSQFYNWTFDEVHYKTDNGKGLSLNVGKSLSSEIGLYIGIDDAAIYNENSDSYEVTHFDIGVEVRFIEIYCKPSWPCFIAKPYFRTSHTRYNMVDSESFGETEIKGSGVGMGLGTYLFLGYKTAIDIGYIAGITRVNKIIGDDIITGSHNLANSGRLKIGVTLFF